MRDNLIEIDAIWVKAVVDEHLKGLSNAQRAEALQYVQAFKDEIYLGIANGIKKTLDDWVAMKNGGSK